jgi:probable addiction module antidote protein
MPERLYDYDPAEALDSAEAIAAFLADAQETGDPAYIAQAVAVAERARQRLEMTALAGQDGGQSGPPWR